LEVDRSKSKPASRRCWFSGPDEIETRVTQSSRTAIEQGPAVIDMPLATTVVAESTDNPLRVFLAYHHNDSSVVASLEQALEAHLRIQTGRGVALWGPSKLQLGARRTETSEEMLRHCSVVVVLATAAYLATGELDDLRKRLPGRLVTAALAPVPPDFAAIPPL